ncbi:MAG: ferritin-like domain-containing protein [Thiobacillaceae bacterium]|nr:ferritin-like domain-containing protein [Thiobacillaceae bacterium]MCX7673019.1 ferritin-like domain-containing protein [Thiobacillaceae bacterium]MDW8323799.1 ferritin-like domain-containing protein [Burkholderiales bacterium]
MTVDPRTLGWLARALNHELRALQQYLAQSVLARLWGDRELAAKLRHEAFDELEHAERLMERLILLGVAPSAGNLTPSRLGRSREELLAADRQLEADAVRLYQEAAMQARRARDFDTAALLEAILAEERAHVEQLDALLQGGEQPHG